MAHSRLAGKCQFKHQHHREVASLPPDEADSLLDWCEEVGSPYFLVPGAIASCTAAPSSFACVCIAVSRDVVNSVCSAKISCTSLARASFCAKSKAAFTFSSANDMAFVIVSLAADGSIS